MTRQVGWRRAGEPDLLALMELERDAHVAAVPHVFDAPFPEDDVLARWAIVLSSADVRVDVVDGAEGTGGVGGPGGLLALTAYDDSSLRHLAVHPQAWGTGLGRSGVERAMSAIGPGATLWCLAANVRARGLYEHLGWWMTGTEQDAPWPPHPLELEYQHP